MIVGGEDLGRVAPGVTDHHAKHCDGQPACPLHAPTDHALRAWPVLHGTPYGLTVRRCPHDAYHPDPDDHRWPVAALAAHAAECDGCCAGAR